MMEKSQERLQTFLGQHEIPCYSHELLFHPAYWASVIFVILLISIHYFNWKAKILWLFQTLNTHNCCYVYFSIQTCGWCEQCAYTISAYTMLSSLFMLMLKFFYRIYKGVLYNYSHTGKHEDEWNGWMGYISILHIVCVCTFSFFFISASISFGINTYAHPQI